LSVPVLDDHVHRGSWVATGLSRWMGCSDPPGSGRGKESINPAKMKLYPGCHNLSHLTSSTDCLQCIFCIWMMVGLVLLESNLQRCSLRYSLLARSDVWEYWEMTCCSCKTKEHQQRQENQTQKQQTNNKTRHTKS